MIRVRIPPVYRELAKARGEAAVERAALDTRAPETLLAIAASIRGDVMVVCVNPPRARWMLGSLFKRAARSRVVGRDLVEVGPSRLWTAATPAEIDEVPVRKFAALFVLGAHAIADDPRIAVRGRLEGSVIAEGEMAQRGHWFFAFCRERGVTCVRLDAAAAVAAFPDQAQRVPPRSSAGFARRYELRDEPIVSTPFPAFARRRLKLETDKARDALSERQRAEADAQLGSGWERAGLAPTVVFDPSPVQRLVMAKERLGRMRGFRKFITVKYRRLGETARNQGFNYRDCVELPGTHALCLADINSRALGVFRMVDLFAKHDPQSPQIVARTKSSIEWANGSTFHVGTAGGSAVGRSFALQRVHGLEVAYWGDGPRKMEQVEEIVAGLSEACSRGIMRFESTPNGREWVFRTYQAAKAGENDVWPIFVRWFDDPRNCMSFGDFDPTEIQDTLSDEEASLVRLHGLGLSQLAFRRAKRKALGRLFAQEYPEDDESCFLTTGTPFFDVELVVRLLAELPDYTRRHVPGGHEVIWEEPIAGEEYVAGCDTSEGIEGFDRSGGSDPNGVGILRKSNGAQVAVVHGRFRPNVLAEHAVRICRKYNDAMLAVERENHGHAVLQKVIELGYDKPHFRGGPLYHHASIEEEARRGAGYDKVAKAGWSTNEVTRDLALNDLEAAVRAGMIVRDRDFLSECLSFRKQRSGKFEADSGSHDDRVMYWAIAWQMMKRRRPKPGAHSIVSLEGSL